MVTTVQTRWHAQHHLVVSQNLGLFGALISTKAELILFILIILKQALFK